MQIGLRVFQLRPHVLLQAPVRYMTIHDKCQKFVSMVEDKNKGLTVDSLMSELE